MYIYIDIYLNLCTQKEFTIKNVIQVGIYLELLRKKFHIYKYIYITFEIRTRDFWTLICHTINCHISIYRSAITELRKVYANKASSAAATL